MFFKSLACVFYIIIVIEIGYIIKDSSITFVRVYCGNPWKKILSFSFIQYLISYKLIAFAVAYDRYANKGKSNSISLCRTIIVKITKNSRLSKR